MTATVPVPAAVANAARLAADVADPIDPIASLRRIAIEPGDALAVKVNRHLHAEAVAGIEAYIRARLPDGCRVIVLGPDTELVGIFGRAERGEGLSDKSSLCPGFVSLFDARDGDPESGQHP